MFGLKTNHDNTETVCVTESGTDLQIPMDYLVYVTVGYAIKDLLNTVAESRKEAG